MGLQQIFARSPEAKGRVERTNGTFQDRLVTELRLAGAATMGEANKVLWDFLPRFNQQFGAPPQQFVSAYRPVEPDMPLDEILSFKYRRKVARDNTIKYNWQIQLANTTGKPSSCSPAWNGPAMLESRWRSRSGWMAVFSYSIKTASSLPRRRHHALELSGP